MKTTSLMSVHAQVNQVHPMILSGFHSVIDTTSLADGRPSLSLGMWSDNQMFIDVVEDVADVVDALVPRLLNDRKRHCISALPTDRRHVAVSAYNFVKEVDSNNVSPSCNTRATASPPVDCLRINLLRFKLATTAVPPVNAASRVENRGHEFVSKFTGHSCFDWNDKIVQINDVQVDYCYVVPQQLNEYSHFKCTGEGVRDDVATLIVEKEWFPNVLTTFVSNSYCDI